MNPPFLYRRYGNCILLLLGLLPFSLRAQPEKPASISLKGYVKDLQSVFFMEEADNLLSQNLLHNRFDLQVQFIPTLYFRAGIRNRLFYGEQMKLIPGFGKMVSRDDGFLNLSRLWVDKQSLAVLTQGDRLLLDFKMKAFRITAGRQRINWGINTSWNPNDLFNAYNLLDFDYEERPGTDALRLQFFPRTFTAVELAVAPSRKKNKNIAAALFKINRWKYDFQLLTALYLEDIMAGGGWAGNIKDAGFKGEIAWFRNKEKPLEKKDALSSSIAFDYTFKNSWYGMFSALFNDHPAAWSSTGAALTGGSLSARQLMPYRWTFLVSAGKAFTPVFTGNLQVIYSPDHHTLIFFPVLAYNLAENMDLDLTAQCFFQKQDIKYKTAGNSIFLRLKWSY